MEFLSSLALILFTLIGYSSGAVVGARERKPHPEFLDILIVIILWVMAFLTRNELGKWLAIGIWMLLAFGIGIICTQIRKKHYFKEGSQRDFTSYHGPSLYWERWKFFSRQIGNYQSRVWLALFYFLIVLPFGIMVRLLSDPLGYKSQITETVFSEKENPEPDLRSARRQF